MQPNPAAEAYLAQQRRHAFQLGRLLADPLISLWIDEDRLEAFVADELSACDPFTARIADAEGFEWDIDDAPPEAVYDAIEALGYYWASKRNAWLGPENPENPYCIAPEPTRTNAAEDRYNRGGW